jgi:hypothetical protein
MRNGLPSAPQETLLRNATPLPAPRAARRASHAAARISALPPRAKRLALRPCSLGCPIFARTFWAKAGLSLSLLLLAVPAFSQATPPPEPDPLARIRAQPPAEVCSEAQPTLCAEAAPKIIANAMGSPSPLEESLRSLNVQINGDLTCTLAPEVMARPADWAFTAFLNAGLQVHTESFTVSFRSQGTGPGQGATEEKEDNVVAEIRGREEPDEIVVLGARLHTTGPGNWVVHDDCEAAVVIEAARDIVATGLIPRRTIRFVLFSDVLHDGDKRLAGSVLGSWAYVRAHRGEMDRTVAAIILDGGTGRVTGYSLGGRPEISAGVRQAVEPLDGLRTLTDSDDAPLNVDGIDFLLEGVPNLVAKQELVDPAPRGDVDFQELRRSAAIMGVTAFDVAEDVAPLGPRLSRAEIDALLKQTGLDEQMKAAGIWQQWESGQRGRQPQ